LDKKAFLAKWREDTKKDPTTSRTAEGRYDRGEVRFDFDEVNEEFTETELSDFWRGDGYTFNHKDTWPPEDDCLDEALTDEADRFEAVCFAVREGGDPPFSGGVNGD
jgi:hypothetical protein